MLQCVKVGFQNGLRSQYDILYVLLVAYVVLHLQIGIKSKHVHTGMHENIVIFVPKNKKKYDFLGKCFRIKSFFEREREISMNILILTC